MKNLRDKMYEACGYGDLNTIKKLVNSDAQELTTDLEKLRANMLHISINREHTEVVDFILKHFLSIGEKYCVAFACYKSVILGKLKVLKFICDSFPDDEHANETLLGDDILKDSIRFKDLDMLQYLLSREDAKIKLNENDKIINDLFLEAFALNEQHILRYLINDFQIKKTSFINQQIEKFAEVKHLFEMRELNQSLNDKFMTKEENLTKKNKV